MSIIFSSSAFFLHSQSQLELETSNLLRCLLCTARHCTSLRKRSISRGNSKKISGGERPPDPPSRVFGGFRGPRRRGSRLPTVYGLCSPADVSKEPYRVPGTRTAEETRISINGDYVVCQVMCPYRYRYRYWRFIDVPLPYVIGNAP